MPAPRHIGIDLHRDKFTCCVRIFGTDHHARVHVLSRCSGGTGGNRHSWRAVEFLLAYYIQQLLERYRGQMQRQNISEFVAPRGLPMVGVELLNKFGVDKPS
jgi:hypothetical protein